MSRPESDDRGYELPGNYDRDAWMEFTPWRPGDSTTMGESPREPELGRPRASTGGAQVLPSNSGASVRRNEGSSTKSNDIAPRRRWWTEDSADRLATGDNVRNRSDIGSDFLCHVPANSRGKVVGTRLGVFGGEWATVEFDNGYSEEVPMSTLKRDSWF